MILRHSYHIIRSIFFLLIGVLAVSFAVYGFKGSYTYPQKIFTGKKVQYVVTSFDGSKYAPQWESTLSFADEMNKSGTPLHFTYFFNAIYLLPESKKQLYTPPKSSRRSTDVGYGGSISEVDERIAYLNRAYTSGHEIASHAVGHLNGSHWSKSDWLHEFDQFNKIFDMARNGTLSNTSLEVPKEAIVGFRAPYFAHNTQLIHAVAAYGFLYDSSDPEPLTRSDPHKISEVIEYPIASIKYGDTHALAMDYNLYVHDTKAKDVLKRGTPAWNDVHDIIVESYTAYFESEYMYDRQPISFGNHFQSWNEDVYWEALKDVLRDICARPDVLCTTYSEVTKNLPVSPRTHN